eukprot:8107989-Pyramimonas_sp.AAC.1
MWRDPPTPSASTPCGRPARSSASFPGWRWTPPSPDLGRLEKNETKVFRRFRPLEALAGPRGRQKTTRDEKPVPGKWSG